VSGGLTEPGVADHDDPTGSPPVVQLGREHPRASPADAVRTLASQRAQGMLGTLTDRPAGYPFGSLVNYALDAEGDPLFVISTMAEHTRNATRDPRASLLVVEPIEEGHDPLDATRITLLGPLQPVPDEEQADATATVVGAVETVGRYAHFGDFSCWRLTVEAIRWVGGFGAMSWVEVEDYRAGVVDPVLAGRRGAVRHMNEDHADACLAIVCHATGRSDLAAARMTGVDRFGSDFDANAPGELVRVRVPFPTHASSLDDLRRQLVGLTHEARAATA
jgi:putative heme iron utilization protein